MRLNRVESFYTFLLCFYSKHSEEEDGQLATTRPPTGAVDHSLATYKGSAGCGHGPLQRGDRLWPRPPAQGAIGCGQPAGAASACGHGRFQRSTHWGGRQRPGCKGSARS
ncbi:hypothetical protein BHM03_00044151, partial [Ensete ventricosum]